MCFLQEPCLSNEQWVSEFHVNLCVVSLTNRVMKIQGKHVHNRDEQINAVYGLPNADMGEFCSKACEPGTWMADILCPGKEIPWATTKRDILTKDFKAKARL
ncbi:hypothetical protein FXO38_02872 [Capsicum annuum]|nr:hypothetical protein FXO38_02872 [Capsicum annuum]